MKAICCVCKKVIKDGIISLPVEIVGPEEEKDCSHGYCKCHLKQLKRQVFMHFYKNFFLAGKYLRMLEDKNGD